MHQVTLKIEHNGDEKEIETKKLRDGLVWWTIAHLEIVTDRDRMTSTQNTMSKKIDRYVIQIIMPGLARACACA